MMPLSLHTGQTLDLLNVMEELADVKVNWYNIGLGLGLGCGTLDTINEQYRCSPSDCLREAIKIWLKTDESAPPTWSKVVKALKTKTVNEISLAKELEQKYCKTQETTNGAAAQSVLTTSNHQAQDASTAVATLSLSTISNTLPNHPVQDTSATVVTLLPPSTIPTMPSHYPAQDTSTTATTPSSQSTRPPYHPAQHTGKSPFSLSPSGHDMTRQC